ncbi:MAG: MBL fold metallo-hydrolase [Proteobacteria bacterium]|nr:MBL fold metallo-hydrolase [Pseudomonadota bacterium]
MNSIKFLGTAGARFVVAKQLRASGGIWLSLDGTNLLIDPGPGSLIRCLSSRPKLDPTHLDGIILSHRHLDHANDINVMVEAMTMGGFQSRGTLFAPSDALDGEPVVLQYIRDYVDKVEVLKENTSYQVKNITFSTLRRHRHPVETYGFKFFLPGLTVSFITDTHMSPVLIEDYQSDIIIINVVLLNAIPDLPIDHLSIDNAKELIKGIKPKVAVLTHFGMTILKAKPWKIAESIQEETGIKVIAASDGMTLSFDEFI